MIRQKWASKVVPKAKCTPKEVHGDCLVVYEGRYPLKQAYSLLRKELDDMMHKPLVKQPKLVNRSHPWYYRIMQNRTQHESLVWRNTEIEVGSCVPHSLFTGPGTYWLLFLSEFEQRFDQKKFNSHRVSKILNSRIPILWAYETTSF